MQHTEPDPDPIQWRDIALDMLRDSSIFAEWAWQLRTLATERGIKQNDWENPFVQVVERFFQWANMLPLVVTNMREAQWIDAKRHMDVVYEVSRSREIDQLQNINPNDAALTSYVMNSHREATANWHATILSYPSKMPLAENRLEIILEVQEIFLILHKNKDLEPNAAHLLANAMDYLTNPACPIEQGNYEIGLAAGSIKDQKPTGELKEIGDRLDKLFSKLPAKPWPAKGFGHRWVEDRFRSDKGTTK